MSTKMKIYSTIAVLVVLLITPFWSYFVPETYRVKVIEVTDRRPSEGSSGTDQLRIRTVRVTNDNKVDPENTLVFRNDDNLFYLKWDSEDLQTKASLWAVKDKNYEGAPTVCVRGYGWRIKILSVFPNALSAWDCNK